MINRARHWLGSAVCIAVVLAAAGCSESGSAANEASAVEETRSVNVVTRVVETSGVC